MLTQEPGGGEGGSWVNFCWLCAAGLQSPYPIIVLSVANYRPHHCHILGKYVIYPIPT